MKKNSANDVINIKVKKLYRSKDDRVIAGICGGVAEYFGWNSTVIRLLFLVASVFLWHILIIAYLAGIFLVPNKGNVAKFTFCKNRKIY